MSELDLRVTGWVGADHGPPAERATTGSWCITAGDELSVRVTEVEDTIGLTVRPHVILPLVLVAEWLLMNWWRLRWEGRPQVPDVAWRSAHCVSAVGAGNPWPPLELWSDGDFVRVQMDAEDAADVSAIRYLRNVAVDVPAADFETAVDRFIDVVQTRLSSVVGEYRDLAELRAELDEERRRPTVARECRWQALAGLDPGDAPEGWLQQAQTLAEEAGALAGDEIMAALPELEGGIETAASVLEAMKRSATSVDLTWVQLSTGTKAGERPWQRGARLAQQMRSKLSLADVLGNDTLGELLSTAVPLQGERAADSALGGGFRNGTASGRARILVPRGHPDSQRFFLARMLGAAHVLGPDEHQELLCPWAALDAFTNEHGLHEEALSEAADHFQVSEWLVRTTLVNRGKLSRHRLPHVLT